MVALQRSTASNSAMLAGADADANADANALHERIVELWLRNRPANTRIAYERDYARFRAVIATKFMNPTKYIQHNPLATDGVEGLREYVSHLPPENHHLKVLRAFQDGPYFSLHRA